MSYEQSKRIRDSYNILPFQGFWTWLTGKELYGRVPLWETRPWETILWHHRFGKSGRWPHFAYLREEYAKELSEENQFDLIDIWGFHNAIKYVFIALSQEKEVHVGNLQYRLN